MRFFLAMMRRRTIDTGITVVALAALLVAVTLGAVYHHHTASSEANCPICHVTHQPVDQPLSAARSPLLFEVGVQEPSLGPTFIPAAHLLRLPARAPPAL